jgi:hypothetical protein
MVKKTDPAAQPIKKARFGESPNQDQNSATAPKGANTVAFVFGNASAIAAAPTSATASADHEEITPLRRVLVAAITLVLMFGLPGCGRQVTPEPASSNLAGKMVIRFRTNGAMDFTHFNYVIVFNTCNQGGEPYPNAFATTFTSYSYAFAVGPNFGGGQLVLPTLFQYILVTGSQNQLNPQPVTINPSTTQFIPNSNGSNTEFSLTFPRALLSNPLAAPNNGCPAAAAFSSTWFINFFTIDALSHVQDSLGIGAANDNTFSFSVDTTQSLQLPVNRPAGVNGLPSNPSAQIASSAGEVDNFP